MHNVLPIEPHLRRRERGRAPKTTIERGVAIPLHREPMRAPKLMTAEEVAPAGTLTERALAARFFPLVAGVVVVDLATKAWAASALVGETVRLTSALSLSLVHNPASAGGVWLGAHTRTINFVATGVVVGLLVMLAPVLTRVDRRAWTAVGLIVGAGLGNLVSMAGDARGVVDFIAVGRYVLNVADVALIIGLGLLARTTFRMLRSVRGGRGGARVR